MANGYMGKALWVDLSQGMIISQPLDETTARKFLGGAGFAAKILWENTAADTDPLSPENPLIFMTGPVTGTTVPSSGRHCVAALSPLTNVWGTAFSGGFWGYKLKRAGFDGVVITGKADRPVYLWIDNGEPKLRDASHIWGKDTFETSDVLKQETDAKASVSAIGPAGEKLVKFACIMNDGPAARAAARCGLGAVMGSKNLKAVVVSGNMPIEVRDNAGLVASIKKYYPYKGQMDPQAWRDRATKHRGDAARKGGIVIKNFMEDEFEGFLGKMSDTMLQGEPYHCWACRYTCSESTMVGGRRRQVYESMTPLGSLCLIDDMNALQEAFDICNKLGVDAISAGGTIAFAMECFEKGLITAEDTGGIELTWGNAPGMLQMLRRICLREGYGNVLAEGSKGAGDKIGRIAPEYAMQVKGLEFAGHDPRSRNMLALEYATANRGATHCSAHITALSRFRSRELGIDPSMDDLPGRFLVKGSGEITARLQDMNDVINSLVVCNLVTTGTRSGQVIEPVHLLEWLNLVTGWDMNLDEFMKVGARIHDLQRLINVRRGMSRKDDTLPPRILAHKRQIGGKSDAAEHLPPLGEMLGEYYACRGWSEEGIPTKERLAELGLEELARQGTFPYHLSRP